MLHIESDRGLINDFIRTMPGGLSSHRENRWGRALKPHSRSTEVQWWTPKIPVGHSGHLEVLNILPAQSQIAKGAGALRMQAKAKTRKRTEMQRCRCGYRGVNKCIAGCNSFAQLT
jgi:hypothetical protein